LEAAFILLEFPSPSKKIFIGSHSLPPSLVRRIGPSRGQIFWDVTVDTGDVQPMDFLAPGSRDRFDANNKPIDYLFRADFSQSSGVERCFLAGSSSELWKWHRKLGHLSFDLLSRLSKLNLV
jgi:hypothetical protein